VKQKRTKPAATSASRALRERFAAARGFLFDMDGTLVLGDKRNDGLRPLPGAAEFTAALRRAGTPFVVLTNGTVRTPRQCAAKLQAIGFDVADDAVLTPASVAAAYFVRRRLPRVLVLGGPGISVPLAEAGLTPVSPAERNADVDAVFIGWFREFGIDDLEVACEAAWRGARVYAASLAPFFATSAGRALGTSRAIAAAIRSITGSRVTVLGKPAPEALRVAARHIGLQPQDLIVVGDDPALEVPMALRGGAVSVAVRSSVGDADAFGALARADRPHLIVSDVAELARLYRISGR
jgi:4-nitrophenyl phosphatase